jgi:GntR family transcriptional regulator
VSPALGDAAVVGDTRLVSSLARLDVSLTLFPGNSLTLLHNCIMMLNTVNQGAVMQYEISSASRMPIYQQLVQQVREAIARGDLKPEVQLPSVRQLSRDLVVNPNTVARAYTELEREGLLNNRPGRGVFVAEPKDELTKDARRRRLLEVLDRFLTEAVHLAFSEEEVLRLVSNRARQFQWNAAKAGSK